MKKILHILFVIAFVCFSSSLHGMKRKNSRAKSTQKNQIQITPDLPQEMTAHIAGYCKPREKNLLLKVCKSFNACLKNRELIVRANPFTVSMADKRKGMFAYARSGNVEMIKLLLKVAKVKPDHRNSLGMTPLHYAMEKDHQSVVQLMIKHGANVHDPKPRIYPLHDAVHKGDKKYVKSLLALKVDPNVTLDNKATPLSIAIHKGYTKIEKLLRAAGAKEARPLSFDDMMMQPITAEDMRAAIAAQNRRY